MNGHIVATLDIHGVCHKVIVHTVPLQNRDARDYAVLRCQVFEDAAKLFLLFSQLPFLFSLYYALSKLVLTSAVKKN